MIDKLMPANVFPPEFTSPTGPAADSGFADYLKNSISEVDSLLKGADQMGQDLVTGKAENLHEAMIGFEKAETALKLLVQVRSKAIEAYNQIMNMQV